MFEFAIEGVSGPIRYITRVPPVPPRRLLPQDTEFRLVEVARRDAYYENRADVVGLVCRAGADMTRHGRWWGGSATCGERPYYFFRVAVETQGAH